MKFKISSALLFLIILFCAQTADASSYLQQAPASRQIEILQQEIRVLSALISNYNLRQEISAGSYIAVDLSDNSVVLEKNSGKSYPIASVTKLMNAVISAENISMSEQITIADQMLKPIGYSPCIFSGMQITAENLLKASLTQSVNDAAEALSYFVGNEKFIGLMNQKAKELGMQNTVYYDATGLNPANQSTASDLAKLIAYVNKKHPELLSLTKDNDFWLPDSKGNFLKFANVNNFYYLPEFVGGKTGYLPEAKQAMASVFQVNGKPFAIIVLHSGNRMADIFSIIRQLKL